MSETMDSGFIFKAIKARHKRDGGWVVFGELRVGTGYRFDANQSLDAWAINAWGDMARVCYEIKISRSDFKRELKHPLKRRRGLLYSNYFYFAAPGGLLHAEEIPPECGLVEVYEDGSSKVIVGAPHRDTMPPTWNFMAAIARRVDSLEKALANYIEAESSIEIDEVKP